MSPSGIDTTIRLARRYIIRGSAKDSGDEVVKGGKYYKVQ
jgi:hypothetical protein